METLNVFVSSTWIDMISERQAIEQASARLRSIRFVGMEHFGARSGTTREVSLEEVDRCEVYLAVIGHRWGSGITEAEYRRARERRLPCLIYFKAGESAAHAQPEADAARLAQWKRELGDAHTVVIFTSPADLAARMVADLHNLVLDQLGGQRAGILQPEYRSRIENFLSEYLGSADKPVPFGGRDAELSALHRWLADPHAPPYAMLAGPAGRGKSALLVHWVRHLALQPDLALVFFPISVRFRTNLAAVAFASITARLAQLHGEPLLAGAETPVEVRREMMAAYLRRPLADGRRLLLVLDGADEAADWKPGPDLFPGTPTEGLRVLVSARYEPGDVDARGWIGRLGWQRARLAWPLDLAPLSASGLADVLRLASLPLEALSERADVVAELFRLSGGDPLVIQLYVADLLEHGGGATRLRPEDLGTRHPGLRGYFDDWWDDQNQLWGDQSPLRKAEVTQVFDVLACALGPLSGVELLELMPDGRTMSAWTLEEVMRSLRRFVVGDGDVQGYAFSHPRLAEHFYEELARLGREREQEWRFVAWGRQWLGDLAAGRRAAAHVPRYLLQFLRPHLERAGCGIDDFLGLATTGWAEAWERIDKGSWGGFAADLRHVRAVAVREDDAAAAHGGLLARLGTELRAAVFTASIATQAGEMPVVLLGALMRRGIWRAEQAITYATRIPEARTRLWSLLAVIALTPRTERPLALAAALGELRSLLCAADGESVLRQLLLDIAREPPADGDVRHAARMLEAAGRLTWQGLEPEQSRAVQCALEDAALSGDVAPERRLLNLAGVAVAVDSARIAHAQAVAREELARCAVRGDSQLPGESLALLCEKLPDEPQWLLPALCAATQVLTDTMCAREQFDAEAIELLTSTWPLVPPELALRSFADLATAIDAPGLETLLARLADDPPGRRARHLETLLAHVNPQLRPRVATLRAAAGPPPSADASSTCRLPGWLGEMSDPDALAWLDQAAQPVARRRTDTSDLAWLLDAFHARQGRPWRVAVATRALCRLEALGDPVEQADALAALLDAVQPAGTGDALEAWRMPPDAGVAADATVHAGALLRPMLAQGGLDATIWTAAQRLAQAPCFCPAGHLDPELERRMAHVAAVMSPGAAEPVPNAAAARLAQQHDAEPFDARELARAAVAASDPRSLAASLVLITQVAGRVGHPLAQQAIAALFDEDPQWRAADLLLAPAAERLPLPDFANVALLTRALRDGPGAASDREALSRLPLLAARLPAPPDELLALALDAVGKGGWVQPGRRHAALVALAGVVRAPQWPRWLEAAMGDDDEAAHALRVLRQVAADRRTFGADLLATVGKLRLPAERLYWLRMVARQEREALDVDAGLAIARTLSDPSMRLSALDLLVRRLARPRRAGVLAEALTLTRQADWPAAGTLELVRMAAESPVPSADLLQAATVAAIAIGDRAVRGQALAALADVLAAQALSDAVATSQRIGDVPARVRTMRRFAEAAGTGREAACATTVASVAALPAGAVRDAAWLYVASLIDPPARWDVITAALPALGDRSTGFDADELVDALAAALPDAPARLMADAIDALRRLRAPDAEPWSAAESIASSALKGARTRALEALMPSLPQGLRLPALVVIAEAPSADSAATLAASWSSAEVAAARRLDARLPASAGALLERIATWHADQARPVFDRAWPSDAAPDVVAKWLREARHDLDRARVVRRLATLAHPPPRLLLQLADAARGIGDAALRATAVRGLSVHAAVPAAGSATARAAEAAGAIEPPAEAALALLQLARRQSGRAREKSLGLAMARALVEPEPRRRLLAAVEVAIESPLRLAEVLQLVRSTSEHDLRARALGRLLEGGSDRWAAEVVAAVPAALPQAHGVALLQHAVRIGPGCETASVAPPPSRFGPLASAALLGVAKATARVVPRARLLGAAVAGLDDAHRAESMAMLDDVATDFAWLEALLACCARWPDELSVERARRAGDDLAKLGDDGAVLRALETLAPSWPFAAWPAYAKAALGLRDDGMRCTALCDAFDAIGAGHAIRDALPGELLAAARGLGEARLRAMAIGRAAQCMGEPDELLLAEAMQQGERCAHALLRIDAWVGICEGKAALAAPVFGRLLDEFESQPLASLAAAARLAPALDAAQATELFDALPLPPLRAAPHEAAALLKRLAPVMLEGDRARLLRSTPLLVADLAACTLLCDLSPCIEGDACEDAALAAAFALRGPSLRAAALAGIADRLSPERQILLLDALSDTPFEAERARRLRSVLGALHPTLLGHWRKRVASLHEEAFAAALEAERAEATTCGRDDDASDAGREAVDAIESLLDELPVIRASPPADVSRLAAGAAPAPDLDGLLDRLARIESEADRGFEIVRALPRLHDADRLGLVAALPLHFGTQRAEATWRIVAATLSPESARTLVPDTAAQAQAAVLAGRLAAAPVLCHSELRAAWLPALRAALADPRHGERAAMLAWLERWAPVIVALGGEKAAGEVVAAVADAGRLWP